MKSCPACGRPAADDFAFCPQCGGSLATDGPAADERRTVTALFCDLVGFTALSEAADPEDVDACLRAFGARAKEIIERYGGTVEKYVGDAVMGVFGVPLTREDDAERAVRAALRLVQVAGEVARPDGSPLQARAGVNTGEVLVRVGAVPASGQGMVTGDAVNVAARLQAAAPPGGVVAGGVTHQLTRRVVRYAALAPVDAKGKAEPVEAWLALAPLSRVGAAVDEGPAASMFTGRDVELAALEHEADEVLRGRSVRTALIVGDAGSGKSRLVTELARRLDARPELLTWRQGCCLPYGEAAAVGAFAEVVTSHAGILDTDDAEVRRRKLQAVVPEVRDRGWMLERLGALVGVPAPASTMEENSAAWSRFATALAAERPLVLVLEDVHRADDHFLGFVEELASGGAADCALLLVLTARAELLERRPDFLVPSEAEEALRPAAVLRVDLRPLADAAVRRIVTSVAGERGRGELADLVVRAAAGNPLHAEEAARLLTADRPPAELPASVSAVYAARLDGLPSVQREVLSDAAVVGATFWDGALVAVGHRPGPELLEALDGLEAAALVRRERASTVAGEREFRFTHAIAREVAYGRLTRAGRAERHAATATWLDAKADGREGAFVEELAHHRAMACQLASAAGELELAAEFRRPALRSLRAAGMKAKAIDAAEVERWYSLAMELAEEDDPLRPALLAEWGHALFVRGRTGEARRAMEAAIDGFKRAGENRAAAMWCSELAGLLYNMDDAAWRTAQDEALRLVEDDGPSEEKVRVLWGEAVWRLEAENDRCGATIATARLADAEESLGLQESGLDYMLAVLAWQGGDRAGLETLRRSELEVPSNDGGLSLCQATLAYDGPAAASRVAERHAAFFARTAQTLSAESFRGLLAAYRLWAGEWEAAAVAAAAVAAGLEGTGLLTDFMNAQVVRLLCSVSRGELATDELVAEVAARATSSQVPDLRFECAVASAAAARAVGSDEDARRALRGAVAAADCSPQYVFLLFPEAVRIALMLGEVRAARELGDRPRMDVPLAAHVRVASAALLAEADGRNEEAAAGFADAAARWRAFGVPYEEGQALLGLSRCLKALGRDAEAAVPLTDAAAVFTRLGAAPALREAEELAGRPAGRGAADPQG